MASPLDFILNGKTPPILFVTLMNFALLGFGYTMVSDYIDDQKSEKILRKTEVDKQISALKDQVGKDLLDHKNNYLMDRADQKNKDKEQDDKIEKLTDKVYRIGKGN